MKVLQGQLLDRVVNVLKNDVGLDAVASSSVDSCLNGGKAYYWNRRTNATVWQSPPGVNVVWVVKLDEDGVPYYWHLDTRVSRYGLPPLPPG